MRGITKPRIPEIWGKIFFPHNVRQARELAVQLSARKEESRRQKGAEGREPTVIDDTRKYEVKLVGWLPGKSPARGFAGCEGRSISGNGEGEAM